MAKVKKRKVGRPPKFDSPEDLEKAVDKYLALCAKTGKPVLLIGFANFLKTDRGILDGYKDKPEFSRTIKRLMLECEESLVSGAMNGTWNAGFAQFLAKNNHGYKDKSEVESDNTHHVVVERGTVGED